MQLCSTLSLHNEYLTQMITSNFFREKCMYSQVRLDSMQLITQSSDMNLTIQRKDRNTGIGQGWESERQTHLM